MENWQLLLTKIIEIGNLVYSTIARVDRSTLDIAQNTKAIENLSKLEARVDSLEDDRDKTAAIAQTLLLSKPGHRQVILGAIAIAISVLSSAAMIYFQFFYHPTLHH